jgi:thiosulfate/3-mercaptopyruvate sulfurtransferase
VIKKLIIGTGSITLVLVLVLVLVVGAGVQANSRGTDAIVTTDWLAGQLEDPDPELVILDIRSPDEYAGGHIPGAINSPEGDWYINDPVPPWDCFNPYGEEFPCMELPAVEDLFETIGNAGIKADSLVVVVSRTVGSALGPAEYAVAGATRVAVTLIYAGVEDVAILDGGWDKWIAEDKETSDDPVTPKSKKYKGDINEEMFVPKDYVEQNIGTSVIVDSRDADVYFGVTQEPWAKYPGHIPGATSLPVPWLWNAGEDYCTYKDTAVLGDMAAGVVGMPGEIIVYCGVGGYASTNYFVLSEVLGYENVKIYDGSAQEWTWADNEVVIYEWE